MSILSLSEFESKGIANKRLVEDAERAVHALVVGLMKEGSHFEEREHATLATGNELLRRELEPMRCATSEARHLSLCGGAQWSECCAAGTRSRFDGAVHACASQELAARQAQRPRPKLSGRSASCSPLGAAASNGRAQSRPTSERSAPSYPVDRADTSRTGACAEGYKDHRTRRRPNLGSGCHADGPKVS